MNCPIWHHPNLNRLNPSKEVVGKESPTLATDVSELSGGLKVWNQMETGPINKISLKTVILILFLSLSNHLRSSEITSRSGIYLARCLWDMDWIHWDPMRFCLLPPLSILTKIDSIKRRTNLMVLMISVESSVLPPARIKSILGEAQIPLP